jgi:hypothetical protein
MAEAERSEGNYFYTLLTAKFFSVLFFLLLLNVVLRSPGMFLKKHGRRHGVAGFIYLTWLIVGFVETCVNVPYLNLFIYDIVLGLLGITLTLTAAADFPHKNIKNTASGTLDEKATVTHSEMIEHSFYQGLNLVQIVYLHNIHEQLSLPTRMACAMLATSPWLARGRFPVNKFSDNYKTREDAMTLVGILYRTKKYQYVFYKHFLLHGLNLSVALNGESLARRPHFRPYWMLLNASYVMEFFLQTLVKKGRLAQPAMLRMQQALMLASTLAALLVLRSVDPLLAAASLALNFARRKHDVANTAALLLLAALARPPPPAA